MRLLATALLIAVNGAAGAQEMGSAEIESIADLQRQAWKQSPAKPLRRVMPLFDRVIAFDVPRNFVVSYQAQSPRHFIQELAPDGERTETWTKLVTVGSLRGAGAAPTTTAALADRLFNPRACTTGPIYRVLGERVFAPGVKVTTISLGCASLPRGAYPAALAGAGEQDFVWLFRDATNVYTLKYSIRGKPWPVGRPPIPVADAERQLAVFGKVQLCTQNAPDAVCKQVMIFNIARKAGN